MTPDNMSQTERGGLSKSEIVELLCLRGIEQEALHSKASDIRNSIMNRTVYLRPLMEFSNICCNDCYYCGLRKSNVNVKRYELTPEEILSSVDDASDAGARSIVLQSGERRDRKFTSYVSYTLKLIKEKHPGMSITLAVGEQERGVYEEFYAYGASRYLLRIETSNPDHYRKLHPESMSYNNRMKCLHQLSEIGFQVGTGIMVNSPHQTLENLADDIILFSMLDIDICSLGPYIPHSDTPFGGIEYLPEETLNLGLNMISVLRIAMPDIYIASTTSLDTLSSEGRELGLIAGANVILPQITHSRQRNDFMQHENRIKGVLESRSLLKMLEDKIIHLGMTPDCGEPGKIKHYMKKIEDVSKI